MGKVEAMNLAIEMHDEGRARVVAESVRVDLLNAAADMQDSDDGSRMDEIEVARCKWLESEHTVAVLRELYGRVCREPAENARGIIHNALSGWQDEAVERHEKLRAARGEFATCAGCGVLGSQDLLKESTGFARGPHCESCAEDDPNAVAF